MGLECEVSLFVVYLSIFLVSNRYSFFFLELFDRYNANSSKQLTLGRNNNEKGL